MVCIVLIITMSEYYKTLLNEFEEEEKQIGISKKDFAIARGLDPNALRQGFHRVEKANKKEKGKQKSVNPVKILSKKNNKNMIKNSSSQITTRKQIVKPVFEVPSATEFMGWLEKHPRNMHHDYFMAHGKKNVAMAMKVLDVLRDMSKEFIQFSTVPVRT
jgi:hypothetical protein